MRSLRLLVFVCLFAFFLAAYAIEPATPPAPNSDPTYQQLRNLSLGSEAVSVSNFTLHVTPPHFTCARARFVL